MADSYYFGTYFDVVICMNLMKKNSINFRCYYSGPIPIDIGADAGKIIGLCCIVELKKDGIVNMPEFINVVKPKLYGQLMFESCGKSIHCIIIWGKDKLFGLKQQGMLAVLGKFMIPYLGGK